jgi:hypothetical protein
MLTARIFNILENILKNHIVTNRILKEKKKYILNKKNYQRIEIGLDNKLFL